MWNATGKWKKTGKNWGEKQKNRLNWEKTILKNDWQREKMGEKCERKEKIKNWEKKPEMKKKTRKIEK